MSVAKIITRAVDFFYVGPLRRMMPIETFRYAATGGANVLFGWVLYWFLYHYVVRGYYLDLGVVVMSPHILANNIQFVVVFFTGFWLNRYVTFRLSPLRGRTQLLRYALSVAGALLLDYALMKLLVEVVGIYPTVAKPVTSLLVIAYSYLMAKYFTFTDK